MGHFHHHHLSDISTFRSLFNADTPLFLILKELVQNADDSGATQMFLGYSPGLTGADHPLLSAPAIFASNNGPFEREHARAIVRFGLSSKGSNSSTVGKFGLGLKSVFAIAEAFMYVDGTRDPSDVWSPPHFDAMNPWHDDNADEAHHASWDALTPKDRSSMLTQLSSLGVPSGFHVWIPLRRDADCRSERTGQPMYIINRSVGDQQISLDVSLQHDLAGLLPILKSVETITLITSEGSTLLTRQGTHRTAELGVMPAGERSVSGEIVSEPSGDVMRYRGTEVMLEETLVSPFRHSPLWPRTNVISLTETMQEPDPSLGHGAAVWQRVDAAGDVGRLKLQWAVFLPLAAEEELELSLPVEFTLTLHGYFFLKSDRKTLYAWDDQSQVLPEDEETLRAQWNALLAKKATLPQVLPTFASLASELPSPEVRELTSAFKKTTLFLRHRELLCAVHQWVRRLTPDGQRWELVSAQLPLYFVPYRANMLKVFPALLELTASHLIVNRGFSSLTHPDREVHSWPATLLSVLLQSTPAEDLADLPEEQKTFMAIWKEIGTSADPDDLVRFLRRLFQSPNWSKWREQPELVRLLIQSISAARVLVLPRGLDEELETALLQANTDILVIPHGLVTEQSGAELSQNDLFALASCLNGRRGTAAMLGVLRASAEQRSKIDPFLVTLPLLTVRTLGSETTALVTSAQVSLWKESGCVFIDTGDLEVLQALQRALGGITFYLVESEVARALGISFPSPHEDIAGAVLQASRLGSPDERLALIKHLHRRPGLGHSKTVSAVRLLLHGKTGVTDPGHSLFIRGTRDETSPELWKAALAFAGQRTDGWRVLSSDLNIFTPQERYLLNVEVLNVRTFQEFIQDTPEVVDGARLGKDVVHALFKQLTDDVLLKRMRLYRSTDGEWVAIKPRTYRHGRFDLDQFLASQVTLLSMPAAKTEAEKATNRKINELTEEFTGYHAWEIVDASATPGSHWQTALRALQGISGFPPDSIKARPWLPLKSGGSVAPKQLLTLDKADEALAKLREAAGTQDVCWEDLDPEVLEHPSVSSLRKATLDKESVINRVAALLSTTPAFSVGRLGDLTKAWFDQFVDAADSLFPLSDLLAALWEAGVEDAQLQKLVRSAQRSLSPDRAVQALQTLQTKLTERRVHRDSELYKLFNVYLTELRSSGQRDHYLESLRLLSRSGEWRPASELVLMGDNFVARSVLDQKQCAALYTPDELEEEPEEYDADEDSAHGTQALLKQLVSEMAPYVGQQDYLGAFMALLDGNKAIHQDAQFYLEKNVKDFRRQALDGGFFGKGRTPLLERLADCRIDIAEILGDRASVPNLLGDLIDVSFKEDTELTSLLVYTSKQRPYWTNRDYQYHYPCSLKRIDFSQPDLDLPALLLNTVKDALRRVGSVPARLDEAWQGLAQGSQVQISATQLTILRRAIGQWGQQLGLPKDSEVRRLLDRIGTLEGREDVAIVDRNPEAQRAVAAEANKLRIQLRSLIEDDEAAQEALLTGVRKKIGEQQYEPASVLFELFQNADDALSEWRAMGAPVEPERQSVVIETVEGALRFAHWGRPINCYRHGTFDGRKEARQYDQDLVKMLTLLASNKSFEGRVTGYFGLGFKSVFLISDTPWVISDRLAFNILGGVYPSLPSKEDTEELRAALQALTPGELTGGTLIELPLREGTNPQDVLQRFAALAPYLLAFSREIRHLALKLEGQPERRLSWTPRELGQGLQLGELRVDNRAHRVLILHGPDVRLMLLLERSGVTAFSTDIPNLWVTVPTKEHIGGGFLVNGMFPLDPGRATLARNTEEVLERAEQWATQLAEALETLSDLGKDWAALQANLGLAPGVTAYEFWAGLWQGLTEHLRTDEHLPVKDLFVRLLWQARHSLRSLYVQRPLLPSGLPGEYQQLVPARQSLRAVHQDLATEEVFKKVSQWPSFRKRFPTDSLLHPKVCATLARLSFPTLSASPVTLIDALHDLVARNEVTSAVTKPLAELLTADFTKTLREGERGRAWLDSLTFLSADGSYRDPRGLLTSEGREDSNEALLAAFAPPHALLHADYRSTEALSVFRQVRSSFRVAEATIAEWLLTATEDRRAAALDYFTTLGLKDPVRQQVLERAEGTWLAPEVLAKSELFNARSGEEQDFLGALLNLPKEPAWQPELGDFKADIDVDDSASGVERPDEATILNRIYEWWTANRLKYVSAYDQSIYPSGLPFVTEPDFDEDDLGTRERWQALFLLSAFQTMGRFRPQQHRDFLQLCQERGWLTTFSQPGAPDKAWMGILREFLQDQTARIDYYHWMRQFMPFYQLSRWLREYALNFIEADKYQDALPLDQLLSPRTNFRLQGTDIEAPPLREALGIGGLFLVRELLRHGALTNAQLHPLAYVPRKRVRALISALSGSPLPKEHGDASPAIHAYLSHHLGAERATFHGDFDLPLYILAGSAERDVEIEALQRELLGGVLRISETERIDWPRSHDGEWRTLPDGRRIPIRG